MKKKYITILIFGILGLILSFVKIQNGDIVESNDFKFLTSFNFFIALYIPFFKEYRIWYIKFLS